MTADLQTILALVVVIVAAVWLVGSMWAKRRNPGCGGGCACPTEKLKRK